MLRDAAAIATKIASGTIPSDTPDAGPGHLAKDGRLLARGRRDGTIMDATILDRKTLNTAWRLQCSRVTSHALSRWHDESARASAVSMDRTVHDEVLMPFGGTKASGYGALAAALVSTSPPY